MSKAAKITAVVVLVLGVLLGVTDRVAAHYAEQEVGKQVAAGLAARQVTSAPPEVTITGYPFLLQVMRGNYDEIRLDLRDVVVGKLPIPLLRVKAYDVRATVAGVMDGSEKVIATKVDGVGTLSYSALVEASGLENVTLSGDGDELRISGNVPIAGVVNGAAKVTVVQGKVRIEVTELTAVTASAGTQQILNQLADRLGAVTFSLPEMPFQLKLVGVTPRIGGLDVAMTANEVELTS